MIRRLLILLALATPVFGQYVTMNGPSAVTSGDGYSVSAVCDSWLNSPYITLYKNGNYVSASYSATDYNGSDTGNQTVSFFADGYDADSVYFSGSLDVAVSLGQMTPPTSANGSTTYAAGAWSPSISAPPSNGTGSLVWCVAGYTNWGPGAWTPPAAGTYTFFVGQLADSNHTGNNTDPNVGNIEVNGTGYTLTVGPAAMTAPTPGALSYSITAGQPWNGPPTYNLPSGNGSGAALWCVYGQNNWTVAGSSSWTPSSVTTYTLFVAQKADGNHTGNTNDPNQGNIEVNGTGYQVTVNPVRVSFSFSGGPYTYDGTTKSVSVTPNPSNATYTPSGTYSAVGAQTYTAVADGNGIYSGHGSYTWTINRAPQSTPSISPISTTVGQGGTVTFTASGGNGGGSYVWGGDASGTGTSVSVTFNTVGTRTVTVYHAGDSNYLDSPVATATITVQGSVSFSFSGGPSFNYDGSTHSVSVSPNPAGATYSTSGTYSAATPGTYTASASGTGNYVGSGSYTWSIGPGGQSPVGISPGSPTVTVGQSVTFTASGGSGTGGFVWGDDASGLSGTSVTVTFNSVGTHYVNVYRAGDSNYSASNMATATITVNPSPPVITSGTSASGNAGASFSYQIAATNSPTSYGASGLPAGLSVNTSTGAITGTPTTAGTTSVTISATNAGGTGSATLTITIAAAPQTDDNTHNQLNIQIPN